MTPFRSFTLLRTGLLLAGLAVATPRLTLAQDAAPAPATTAPAVAPALVAPTVPDKLEFADLTLTLTDGARASVQKLVDALYRHPAYLAQKVERTGTYFPIIDRVLKEEGVPADFRYLAVQESGLVSDAVSTSNAVGFWQFKRESATELGARVDDQVDERRHIVESTRVAAKYFKRSNAQLHNWLNSLMSYYVGLGGTKKMVKPEEANAHQMEINEKTHSYVITFLAHKLAFEGPCATAAAPSLTLQEVKAKPGQSLQELAQSLNANPEEVVKYNKWLLGATVPTDKEYTVIVPVTAATTLAATNLTAAAQVAFPEPTPPQLAQPELTQVNGLKAVVARRGDSPEVLALVAGMDVKRFRFLNDLDDHEGVVDGRAYYLQKKRNKAQAAEYHVSQPGESIQQVAQQYGVKTKSLRKMNRMDRNAPLEPGRLLWLQHTRPTAVPIEYVSTKSTAPNSGVVNPAIIEGDTADVDDNLTSLNEAAPATAATTAPPTATASMVPISTPTPAPTPSSSTPAAPPVAAPSPSSPSTTPKPTAPPVAGTPAPATPKPTAPAPAPAVMTPPPVAAQDTTRKPVKPKVAPAVPAPASPAPTATTTPSSAAPLQTVEDRTHTVGKGESLSVISRQYGVSVKDLMAWNSMASPNLRIGQKLRLSPPTGAALTAPLPAPKADADSAGATWHVVQPGESLYRLSKQYDTTVQKLMEWNNLSDFNVKLGQKLVVKKGS